jgi:hypothetical protein
VCDRRTTESSAQQKLQAEGFEVVLAHTLGLYRRARVRCYPKVRRYYERQLKRHQGRGRQMICYNIIAHKLAQAAFHVL